MSLDDLEKLLSFPQTRMQLHQRTKVPLEKLKGLLSLLTRDHKVVALVDSEQVIRFVQHRRQPIPKSRFGKIGWLGQQVLEVPCGRFVRGRANEE